MKTAYVVIAFGGSYEDAWERNVRAFHDEADAKALIENYEKWIEEIRNTEPPEALAEHNWDFEDDRQSEMYMEAEDEWKRQVLLAMGVPECDHDFMLENWEHSYDCDRPNYKIEELELA